MGYSQEQRIQKLEALTTTLRHDFSELKEKHEALADEFVLYQTAVEQFILTHLEVLYHRAIRVQAKGAHAMWVFLSPPEKRALVNDMLKLTDGNLVQAAKRIGIARETARKWREGG